MRQAAKNRWFSVQSHLFFIPFFTHKELCELLMKSASRQNAEAQKFVQQKTTLAAAGQRLYNQTKSRKEGFQVNIKIIQRQCGGTEFLSQPHRLHLGAQNAAGVDELCFTLPEAWAGCTVALYLRRSDGTLLAPVSLDTQHCVTVDRRLTGSTGGQWMLAAIDASGYAAYTRPGSYDTYAILPTDGGAEELPPSQYEQFVARVLESASTASTAAQRAAASAASTASNAAQAQTAAQRTSADSAAASRCAARAEAAAARAEELVPTDGQVVSVNGKSGIVKLTAQDVGALPCPAVPVSGQLLRVLSVDPNTGAVLTDTAAMPDLSPYLRSSTVPTASAHGFGPRRSAGGPRLRHQRAQRRNSDHRTSCPRTAGQHDGCTSAADRSPAALRREEGSDHRRSRRGMDRCRKGKRPAHLRCRFFFLLYKGRCRCSAGRTQLRCLPGGQHLPEHRPHQPCRPVWRHMGADRIGARADGCQQ